MARPSSRWRALLCAVVTIGIAASCGGDDSSPPTGGGDSLASDDGADADESGDEGAVLSGDFGSIRLTVGGTLYEWQASCGGVRAGDDGPDRPIVASAGTELTTGALIGFMMESDGTIWSIDMADPATGEVWTFPDQTVGVDTRTLQASGDVFSTLDATPQPFELSVTCP